MAKVGVVGGGAWGTAIAAHAARIGHETRLWAVEIEVVEDINVQHQNSLFLPDVSLPDSLTASTNPAEVMRGVELVILVPPSKHLRAVSTAFAPHVPPNALIAAATKGIEESSLDLLSTVLAQTMPAVSVDRLAFLSGPT